MTENYPIPIMKTFPFYKQKQVLICGGNGFIGSHLTKLLLQSDAVVTVLGKSEKLKNIKKQNNFEYISANLLELNNCKKILKNFDYVFQVAGITGGIEYNIEHEKQIFSENSLLNLNLLLALTDSNVQRYQYISSVAVYPNNSSNQFKESDSLNFENEKTRVGYGWAKRLGELQCKSFAEEFGMKISVIRPDNTFGPNDNFSLTSARVIPSLIKKTLESNTTLQIWGSGKQVRTFIFVKDLIYGMLSGLEKHPDPDPINLSSSEKISIKSLAELIIKLTKKDLKLEFDTSKPEGNFERCLDITKAKKLLDFSPEWNMKNGLSYTIDWYKNSQNIHKNI